MAGTEPLHKRPQLRRSPIGPNLLSLHVLIDAYTHVYFPAEIDRVSGSKSQSIIYIQIIVRPTMGRVVLVEGVEAPD